MLFSLDKNYKVMEIFDTEEEKHHKPAMYSLYNQANFFKASYNNEKKVLTHGVTRKGTRGIPWCIKQEKLKSNKAHIDTRGTPKEAVLKRDKKKLPKSLKLVSYMEITG